jgi:TusA-related sulfurtransferase
MGADVELDERGHRCPHPVIALGRAAREHPAGTIIAVLADDPVAVIDIPAWCHLVGATYLGESDRVGDAATYLIRL